MARHAEEHEEKHDERWLVSYADFITLLMVLFVILYFEEDITFLEKLLI